MSPVAITRKLSTAEKDAKVARLGSSGPLLNGIVNGQTTAAKKKTGSGSNPDDDGSPLPIKHLREGLGRELESMSLQRDRVLRIRVSAHEKRNRLRHQRNDISTLEADFYRALNHFIIKLENEAPRPLLSLYEQLQSLRDAFGPLEDDYNQIENLLDQEEYSLEGAEERFYNQYASINPDSVSIEQPESPKSTTPISVLQSGSEVESDGGARSPLSRSLLREYHSRLGDANLLREKLADLLLGRSEVMDEESSLKRRHLPPLADHIEFWESFDRDWFRMIDELRIVEAEVQGLKQRVREKGLPTLDFASDASNEHSLSKVEEHYESHSDASAEHRDPIAAKDPLRSNPLTTRERVHYWLLSVMNASPHEMRLFRIRTRLENEFPDEQEFMRMILYVPPPGDEERTLRALSSGPGSGSGKVHHVSTRSDDTKFVLKSARDWHWHWAYSFPESSVPKDYADDGVSSTSIHTEPPLAQDLTYISSGPPSV